MNTVQYTAPSSADLKEKEVKDPYISKARELLTRVMETSYTNPIRITRKGE